MLVKEGKKQDQAVAQCLSMFKEHWKAKGATWVDKPNSKEYQEALASFSFDDCPECVKLQDQINRSHGIFELDIAKAVEEARAKISTQCDFCKTSIDTKKPVVKKGEKPPPVEALQAELNAGGVEGVTKLHHFCDEECLRQFLNKRARK
jgi:hypothetical protein